VSTSTGGRLPPVSISSAAAAQTAAAAAAGNGQNTSEGHQQAPLVAAGSSDEVQTAVAIDAELAAGAESEKWPEAGGGEPGSSSQQPGISIAELEARMELIQPDELQVRQ
jgi:hypothetical protein